MRCNISALVSGGLLAVVLATPAFAQYGARTDTAVVPYPAEVPQMGEAGSCTIDPGFNSTICAVTDANTDPSHPNTNFNTTNYSGLNAWNFGSTAFYFLDNQAAMWVAAFDPAIGAVKSLTKNGFGDLNHAEYSFTNPTTVTGTLAYPLIRQRKYGVETTLRDVRKDYQASPIPYADDFEGDIAGDRYSLVAWPEQNIGRLFYVWDTKQGYTYLDTQTLTVTGQWGAKGKLIPQSPAAGVSPTPIQPFYIHQASLSRDGRWAVIAPGKGSNQEIVWQVGTRNAWAFSASGPNTFGIGTGGHDAVGYSTYYDTDGVLTTSWLPDYWVSLRLGRGGPIKPLASTVMSRFKDYGSDYHVSALAAHGGNSLDQYPVLVSTEYVHNPHGVGVEPAALAPYMNEIDGLCTNCSKPTIWRFAHTYHNYPPGRCCGPTGNVSQDGNWFVFTSNWACTRGLDTHGNCRTDVFVVNLQSAHPKEQSKERW
ncbi:MAG TPA: hypothetical protein VG206_15235 [Terriglobia bacterium]|nr:hypothetical protein [Terriglobia bacterium]